MTRKPEEVLTGRAPWVRQRCQAWIKRLLDVLVNHGDALTMALCSCELHEIPLSDNVTLADDFIAAAEAAGWIERGKHAATLTQRQRSGACSPQHGTKFSGYPTEWNWVPGPMIGAALEFAFKPRE